MRIDQYLDEAMRINGYKRDKQLADLLGVSPVSISNYRHGDRFMDNEKCVKLALELNVDPVKVIMATDMDKADKSGKISLWEIFSQRMAATAACVPPADNVALFAIQSDAAAVTSSAGQTTLPAD